MREHDVLAGLEILNDREADHRYWDQFFTSSEPLCPDLLLLDLNLLKRSGFEILRRIGEAPPCSGLRVMMSSSASARECNRLPPDKRLLLPILPELNCNSMARYRIHRMKDTPRENFRWAPHTSGLAIVKPKDYEVQEDLEAATPYAAWKQLQAAGRALHPGDMLELCPENGAGESCPPGQSPSGGQLFILKYIGFEPAGWFVPAAKPEANTSENIVS